ncbi:MAG TPA: AEC family transporter [Burkholderiaceae bacterium]|nr:AEC family transporter [Burkholderiaceae bacterium]
MQLFLQQFQLAAPLFALVLIGYLASRYGRLPLKVSAGLSRFVFTIAIPALLFRLMSRLALLPSVDFRLLFAYFGGCLVVFVCGRVWARAVFGLDGVSQSVFGLGGIFSNNVLLGVPLVRVALGEAAMPAVALVLVFNALLLWMLVTVSVEWARHGELSLRGFGATLRSVLTNPVVASILAGTAYGFAFGSLPPLIDLPLRLVGEAAGPLALIALGMGLAEYGVRQGWRAGAAIATLKLLALPMAVWVLTRVLGLSRIETQVVVLLAALPVGVNVYLMSREFRAIESAVAAGMVLSTILAAATTPVLLAMLA